MPAVRSLLTITSSEGHLGRRYYGGNGYIDKGGHLSHGNQTDAKKAFGVSLFFETTPYKLDRRNGYIYYKQLKVCNKQEAVLLEDMTHSSGLVASTVICSPFEYATGVTCATQLMSAKVYTSVVFGKSLFSLEGFGNEQTIFNGVSRLVGVAISMLDHMLYFGNIAQFGLATIGAERATEITLDSNLEDKVLIEDGSIVMNGPGLVLAKQPNTELSGYIWDPGR